MIVGSLVPLLDKSENNMISDFIALTVQGRLVFNSHCYPNCHHKGDIDCYPICEAEAISKEYCSKQSIQDTDTHYVSSVRRKMQSVSNASIKRWGRRRRGRRTRRRRKICRTLAPTAPSPPPTPIYHPFYDTPPQIYPE